MSPKPNVPVGPVTATTRRSGLLIPRDYPMWRPLQRPADTDADGPFGVSDLATVRIAAPVVVGRAAARGPVVLVRIAGVDAPTSVHTGIRTSHDKGGIYRREQEFLQ